MAGTTNVGIELARYTDALAAIRMAASTLHATNGIDEPGNQLNVDGIKQLWAIYDELTTQMNQLEALLSTDLERLRTVGDNQVALDRSFGK